jgi:hypothetical protein
MMRPDYRWPAKVFYGSATQRSKDRISRRLYSPEVWDRHFLADLRQAIAAQFGTKFYYCDD